MSAPTETVAAATPVEDIKSPEVAEATKVEEPKAAEPVVVRYSPRSWLSRDPPLTWSLPQEAPKDEATAVAPKADETPAAVTDETPAATTETPAEEAKDEAKAVRD